MREKDGKDTKDVKHGEGSLSPGTGERARERGKGINSACYNPGQLVPRFF
jgi:hypothetical protein